MSSRLMIEINKKLANFLIRNIFGHEPCHDFNPINMGDRLASLNDRIKNLFNLTSDIISGGDGDDEYTDYIDTGDTLEHTDDNEIEKYVNMEEDSTSDILNTNVVNSTVFTGATEEVEDTEVEKNFNTLINNDYSQFVQKFGSGDFGCKDMVRINKIFTRSHKESIRKCINGIQIIFDIIDENRMYVTSYSNTNQVIPDTENTEINIPHEGGRIDIKRERPKIFDENTDLMPKDGVMSVKLKDEKLKDEKNITNKTVTEYDQLLNVFQFLIQTFEELNFPESVKFYQFYRYAVIYFIKNINNTLSIYSINNCNFIKDSLFYYFVNKYTNEETNQFLNLDNRQKNGILNEIYRIRLKIAGIDGEKNIFDVYAYRNEDEGEDEGEDEDEGEIVGGKKKVKMGPDLKNAIYSNKEEGVSGILTGYLLDLNVIAPGNEITDQNTFLANIKNQSLEQSNEFFNRLQEITYYDTAEDGKYQLKQENFNKFKEKVETPMNREFDNNKNRLLNAWKRRGGRGGSKYIDIVKEVINTISSVGYNKIFQNIHIFKSIQAEGDSGTPNSLSSDSRKYVNDILQSVCTKVNKILRSNLTTEEINLNEEEKILNQNIINGKIFLTEKQLIDKVASGGNSSKIDDALMTAFTNFLKKNTRIDGFVLNATTTKQQGKWFEINNPSQWLNIDKNYQASVERVGTRPAVSIINNAMTTEVNSERIVKLLNDTGHFTIRCPITSILDSQMSFGSCTGGTNASNIVKDNLNISIETPTDGSTTIFAFTMELIHKKSGKTILSYSLQYKDFFIGPQINVDIGKKTLNILSANNSFSEVLREIENYASKLPVAQQNNLNNILESGDLMKIIMAALSRKFMGDFSQELNSITEGVSGLGDGPKLLCNGDRPSFVRASLLTLLANRGINEKAGVLYMSNNGGYLIKKNGKIWTGETSTATRRGGKKTKKRRKISRKKKGHKKTKKRRTIKKNRKN